MRDHHTLVLTATTALMLAAPATAYACPDCSAAGFCVMPAGALWGGWVAPVVVLLAAVMKRPFVSWAGVTDRPLYRSLQATALSACVLSVAGFVMYAIAWAVPVLLPIWAIAAIVFGAWIESAWLNRIGGGAPGGLRRGTIVLGNFVVAGAMMGLLFGEAFFQTHDWRHVIWAKDVASVIAMPTGLVAAAVLAASFTLAGRLPNDPRRYRSGRAFEVVMPGAAPQSEPIEDAIEANPPPALRSS